MEEYLDGLIYNALASRKKVILFLCKDEEGGFGIKIDGKVVARNLAWECFEYKLDELKEEEKNRRRKKCLKKE